MSEITKRAMTRRAMLQGSALRPLPDIGRAKPQAAAFDRSAIVLGRNQHGNSVLLPQRPRMEHSHVIGTTGGGKSKFFEHCIRQDIANGCGVLVSIRTASTRTVFIVRCSPGSTKRDMRPSAPFTSSIRMRRRTPSALIRWRGRTRKQTFR